MQKVDANSPIADNKGASVIEDLKIVGITEAMKGLGDVIKSNTLTQ